MKEQGVQWDHEMGIMSNRFSYKGYSMWVFNKITDLFAFLASNYTLCVKQSHIVEM